MKPIEPPRHEVAAATVAVKAAIARGAEPEELASAALVAAANAGAPKIPNPITVADLAMVLIPREGAIVYLASLDDSRVVSARIAEAEVEEWGCKFKLVHPDAPNGRLKGFGHVKWFDGGNVYANESHAHYALAQQAEDFRQSIEDSGVDYQRVRDHHLAAAEDAIALQAELEPVLDLV